MVTLGSAGHLAEGKAVPTAVTPVGTMVHAAAAVLRSEVPAENGRRREAEMTAGTDLRPPRVPPAADRTKRVEPKKHWWRRPWVGPLGLVVVAFLAYSLPPYLAFDPARSRVPSTFPAHYLFLVGHVVFGSVAMVTAALQIWPWIRRKYPVLHRCSGRAYVFMRRAALRAAGVDDRRGDSVRAGDPGQ